MDSFVCNGKFVVFWVLYSGDNLQMGAFSYHYKPTRKTSKLFLLFNTGVDYSLRNNFAKVSVSVHNYNSLQSLCNTYGIVFLMITQLLKNNKIYLHCLIVSKRKSNS